MKHVTFALLAALMLSRAALAEDKPPADKPAADKPAASQPASKPAADTALSICSWWPASSGPTIRNTHPAGRTRAQALTSRAWCRPASG